MSIFFSFYFPRIRRRLGIYAESTTTQGLLFIPVFVVDADEGAAEGEYFAKGDEDRVVDLCQWWADKARGEHYAPEGAESNGYSQLKIFHIFKI